MALRLTMSTLSPRQALALLQKLVLLLPCGNALEGLFMNLC